MIYDTSQSLVVLTEKFRPPTAIRDNCCASLKGFITLQAKRNTFKKQQLIKVLMDIADRYNV